MLVPFPEKNPVLYNVHYRVGKGFQQKEEKQAVGKKEAQDYGEVHGEYPCIRVEHQRTDILSLGIPRSVIKVRKDMIAKKEEGQRKDVFQICRAESIFAGSAEHAGQREH